MEKLAKKYLMSPEEIMKSFYLLTMGVPICFFLGIIFTVIGVISEAARITFILSSIIWLLLAIASFFTLNTYVNLH